MLANIIILWIFSHWYPSLSSLPAPAGRVVPPSASPRPDYDSQPSPHALHHNDDDDSSDSADNDDSDEGDARSPSASYASDSSHSSAKPGLFLWMLYVCLSEKNGSLFINLCICVCQQLDLLSSSMHGLCVYLYLRVCWFVFTVIIPNAKEIEAARRQRRANRGQKDYISLGRDGHSSAGSTPDHYSREDEEDRIDDDDDDPDDHERRIEFAPRLRSIRERIAEKLGMRGRKKSLCPLYLALYKHVNLYNCQTKVATQLSSLKINVI